jgi:predicted RNase H-like HicB family nuclease
VLADRILDLLSHFIEEGTDAEAFEVVVPDLPGCFSAGDTLDEAVEAAKEAAAAWLDAALDQGMPVPPPSSLDEARKLRGYKGWAVGLIELEDRYSTTQSSASTLPCHVASCVASTTWRARRDKAAAASLPG